MSKIEPLLASAHVEFVGEVNDSGKNELLAQAAALLFPIDWPEPFGLVMIEAMACGTPVLAFRRGSVEEVVDHGVTGHIVDSIEDAILTLPRIVALNRRTVRRRFEDRFTSRRMAKDYLRVYKSLHARPNLKRGSSRAGRPHEAPAGHAIEPNESV